MLIFAPIRHIAPYTPLYHGFPPYIGGGTIDMRGWGLPALPWGRGKVGQSSAEDDLTTKELFAVQEKKER